jgi:KDO2-lipid IV(A) lauroyltransferase
MYYWFLWTLVNVGGRLPRRFQYTMGWLGGMLAWYVSRRVRHATLDHARHVLGPDAPQSEVARVARSSTRTNLYYYADFARFGVHQPAFVFDLFDHIEGVEHLVNALEEGRGAVLVGAHLGNSEVIAQAAAPFDVCLAILTEPLNDRRVHEFIHRVRSTRGVRFLPANSHGLRQSIGHLKAGGALGLLVDRDVLGTAKLRPFFGEPAPIPSGAVDLAVRMGAPMFAVWTPRTSWGRYALYVERVPMPQPSGDRERDVERGMEAMVAALEAGIRRWPGQWFPISPVWPRRPH